MPCKGIGDIKLDGLQAELLSAIASFLPPVDVVSFGRVCRRTAYLLWEKSLWKTNINAILSCDSCLYRMRPLLSSEEMIAPTHQTFRRLVEAVQSELNSLDSISLTTNVCALFRAGWCRPLARWMRSPEARAFNEGSGLHLANASLPPMEGVLREKVFLLACRVLHWDFVLELLQEEPLLALHSNPQVCPPATHAALQADGRF